VTTTASTPLLQVRLSANYGKRCVLRNICFDLCAGEALGMVGTSGAGKTSLVMALIGLLDYRGGNVTGEVLLNGVNLLTLPRSQARRIRGKLVSLIPQSPMTALNPAVSLKSHFVEAWRAHESTSNGELEPRLEKLLEEVQLPATEAFLRSKPGQISVGQAQRILIALALLHRPPIIIADEPTSALDPVTQIDILKLLKRLKDEYGTALLYVSHDLLSVLQLCDAILVLDSGNIAERVKVTEIEGANHPVTLSLLRSLPVPPHAFVSYYKSK
jgi:peptide/nickel transport system ATP-binding protein